MRNSWTHLVNVCHIKETGLQNITCTLHQKFPYTEATKVIPEHATSSVILNFNIRWRRVVIQYPQPPHLQGKSTIPTELEDGWVPQPFSMLLSSEKSFTPVRNRTTIPLIHYLKILTFCTTSFTTCNKKIFTYNFQMFVCPLSEGGPPLQCSAASNVSPQMQ